MKNSKRFYYGMKGIVIISISLFFIKCDSAESIEPISGDKCYEGEIIHGFCPGYIVVNVTNGKIGGKWSINGKVYNNAILIKNASISDKEANVNRGVLNTKVYFLIDAEATNNKDNCQLIAPCTQWAENTSAPEKHVCIKYMSDQKCNNL